MNHSKNQQRCGRMNVSRSFLWVMVLIVTVLYGCKTVGRKPQIQQEVFRFAVASDGHFGQEDTDYEANFDRLIGYLNRENESRQLDFVVLVGDLFHNDPRYLAPVKKKLDQLVMPYYAVRGNHDMATDRNWEKTWGYPDNHAFELGDYGFILASTSDETGEYLCADTDWLWQQLDAYHEKKGIFVFMHITPKDWTGSGIDCPEVRNALETHDNVMAVFQGHDHDEDGLKVWAQVPYYFDGHFGGSFGTPLPGYRIVEMDAEGTMKTYQFRMDVSPISNETVQHLAFLKSGQFENMPSEKYDPGPLALVDGTFGSLSYNDGRWLGIEGEDLVYTIDLGSVQDINRIQTDFLVNLSSWIFPPVSVRYEISTDGTLFEEVFYDKMKELKSLIPISRKSFEANINRPARYIRIRAESQGICPEWHDGNGGKAWLFTDEMKVY